MRFGRTLELSIYAPWRDQYVDYAKLKKLLRDDDSAPSSPSTETKEEWTEEDESKFVDELVNTQLEKVYAFHQKTYDRLGDRTEYWRRRLAALAAADNGSTDTSDQAAADKSSDANNDGQGLFSEGSGNGNGKKPVTSESEKQDIMKEALPELNQISKEVDELEKYGRINYTGFFKAAKKHDRKRGASYRVRPLLQVRLSALPFNKADFQTLWNRLSSIYTYLRQNVEGEESRGMIKAETQEGTDEYTSHKYWIHPDNVLEVKTMILRRLPLLVYNPQTSRVAEGSPPDSTVTSLYFDNPAFSLYTNKVDHSEAASLRLRWYGQLDDRPQVWVEKKVVKEDGTSAESRIQMKEKYVQGFIKNEYHMDKQVDQLRNRIGADSEIVKDFTSSVEEIQTFIKANDLQPMVRANYLRTAFQIPDDDSVRISLDTELAFIREDALDVDRPCRDPEAWHRQDIDGPRLKYPFKSVRKGEASLFPFALLELKIRNTGKTSEWIQDLMNSHLVKEAPRFSKFVHGVAQLFEDYVNTFPFWLSEMETDIRRDPQQAFEEEQAKRQKQLDDQFAVGSLLKNTPLSAPRKAGILSPVGSPSVSGMQDSAAKLGQSLDRRTSALGSGVVSVGPTQQNETAEEPDDDETGEHVNGDARPVTSTLKRAILPSFSNSKYAQARRHHAKLPPGVTKPSYWIKDQGPLKVEGKVWLANQRTFIKWQHVAVLLGSLSLGLYNAAGENNDIARALAVVYVIIAIFAGGWGYGVYMWRTNLIEKRSGKDFDAIAGPIVVCGALIVALLLNFAFKYRAAVDERERLTPPGNLTFTSPVNQFVLPAN